jgi:uncharacterized protein YecT (DUF1311 family)
MCTTLFAKVELKDGNYSWYGASQAFLTVEKVKENRYHISGDCYYGVGRKYGPNMGDLDFVASLKNGKIVYKDTEYGDYVFILTVNKDGSFDVNEKGMSPFGHNASFYGHFTSDDLPSFSCSKASTFVEKAICNNVQIARLDKKMARSYAQYKSAFFFKKNRESLEKNLKKEQRKWIKKRNKCEFSKTYKNCLIKSYEGRIKAINKDFGDFWKYDD